MKKYKVKCPECKGKGYKEEFIMTLSFFPKEIKVICTKCGGKRKLEL